MKQRIRITFSKTGPARYSGHLDLHRAWERTLRRAGAPVAYSEGFHPQPRLQFAAPLPLGFTSECEIMDVFLTEEVDLHALRQELNRVTPSGIDVHNITSVPPGPGGKKAPSLPTLMRSATYTITLKTPNLELPAQIAALLAQDELICQRKRKTYNLRPLIETLTIDEAQPDRRLHVQMSAREGATGRPQDLLTLLHTGRSKANVHRTQLTLADKHA